MKNPKTYLFSGLGSSLIPSFREGNVKLANRILGLGSIPRQFVWNDWEVAFREIYIEYKKEVPRFFPKFSLYKNRSNISPEIKKAFKSERSTFIAMGTFLVLFVLRIYFF